MDNIDTNPTTMPSPPPIKRFGGMGRKAALTVTTVGLLTGGIAGGYVIGHAATTTPTSSTATTTAATTSPGKFVSNETASHEAGESAAREAQENAAQVPTVP